MHLNPNRCKETPVVNNSWSVTLEEGTELDDVLAEEFFANVAQRMRPYDKIMVRTDDGAWYAELLVLSVGKTWVRAVLLFKKALEVSRDSIEVEGYEVLYKGPQKKFCVIRKVDNSMIHEGEDSRETAFTWLAEFMRAA